MRCNSEESRYFLLDSVAYLSIPASLSSYVCIVVKIANDVSLRKEMGIDHYHLQLISIQEKFTKELSQFDFLYVIGNRGFLFQRRFYEPCKRMKQAIADGKIGKLILGDVTMLG